MMNNTFAGYPVVEPTAHTYKLLMVKCPCCGNFEKVGLTDYDIKHKPDMIFRSCIHGARGFMVKINYDEFGEIK